MTDNLSPGIGTIYSVCATLPANELAATYAALTWIEVGEVTEVPEYGAESAVVTHTPIKTGRVAKYHGEENNGSIALPFALDRGDNGQAALETARSGKARIAHKVEYPDGTCEYFQGKVMSFKRSASAGSVVSGTAAIEIETAIVVDEP